MVAAAAPARVRAELEDRGCDPRTASSLVAEAVAEAAGRRSLSDATLRTALYAVVTRRLRERTALGGRDERGRCVALIGPTGAGKTLALSKLMAQHLQRGSSGVTVVKMESKRSPGIDPLQVTAAELGALVHVARSRRELAAVIAQRSASDVMLVDTPGMSGLDRGAVGRVREWCSTEVPLEVHLVLPASMIRQDFDELLLGYAGLPIHRLLFTKIDETVRHGRMLEIALRSTLPLSYLAEGQDPRHGIEVATPDRVAGLVCRGDAGAVDDIASDLEREEEPACGAWMGGAGRHAVRTPGTTFEGGVEWNRP